MNRALSPDRVRALSGVKAPEPKRGPGRPNYKLTKADIAEIRQRRANGEKQEAIAMDYGIGRNYVSMLCSNQRRVE